MPRFQGLKMDGMGGTACRQSDTSFMRQLQNNIQCTIEIQPQILWVSHRDYVPRKLKLLDLQPHSESSNTAT